MGTSGDGVLTANDALLDHWYVAAASDDIRPGPVGVRILGRDLVLWRAPGGSVVAAPDRCPHREAPLSHGSVERHGPGSGLLVCPYHGWSFGDGGRCERVPSAGTGVPPPPRAHMHTAHCEEAYGLVWVCIGDPTEPIPAMAWESDPAYRRINTPVEIWRCSATRMTDNFLDIAHFPWVHTATLGRGQDTVVPKLELTQLDDEFFGYRYEVVADNSTAGAAASGQSSPVVHRAMSTGFRLPFTVRSTIRYDTGLDHVLLLLSTPVDDVTSLFTFVVWRNDDVSAPAEEAIRFDLAIGAEDKQMLEQIDGVLPLDQTTLVHVQADKCGVEWRRRLAELMKL